MKRKSVYREILFLPIAGSEKAYPPFGKMLVPTELLAALFIPRTL